MDLFEAIMSSFVVLFAFLYLAIVTYVVFAAVSDIQRMRRIEREIDERHKSKGWRL